MERKGIIPSFPLLMLIIMLDCFATSNAPDSDIKCLKSIKESLEYPSGSGFSNWDFKNISEGVICNFDGVECWQGKNIIHRIQLPGMGLRGQFPICITNCTYMETLDLSSNYLSGPIPSNLGNDLSYIVYLNLSNNTLSGPIPPTIVNCSFINVMRLDNNNLTGEIPWDLTELNRIKVFNVSNNRLSGHVPVFGSGYNFSVESFANNSGLCGDPLKACEYEDDIDDEHDDGRFLSGFIVGFPLFTILSMLVVFFFLPN